MPTFFALWCVMLILYFYNALSDDARAVSRNVTFPKAFTPHNRVLGMILFYDWSQYDPLSIILAEFLSLCESGWDVKLAIYTTVTWDMMKEYYRRRLYCYRTQRPLEMVIYVHPANVSIGLAAVHRKLVQQEINKHDLFVYLEADIILKASQVSAFVFEQERLYHLLSKDSWMLQGLGFLRYCRNPLGNSNSNMRINSTLQHLLSTGQHDRYMTKHERYLEMPRLTPVCIKDQRYINVTGNVHQAMWMMTREQILALVASKRCRFFDHGSLMPRTHGMIREYMSSFSIFISDYPTSCQLHKLIPYNRVFSFSVHHYICWKMLRMSSYQIGRAHV